MVVVQKIAPYLTRKTIICEIKNKYAFKTPSVIIKPLNKLQRQF